MIKIGQYNDLRISRFTDFGVYLTDDDPGSEPSEVLLPARYVDPDAVVGDSMEVFVYTDSEDRPVAVTERPFACVDEFAFLQVVQVNKVGAFLDWGLPKNLLCPFSEQKVKMHPGGIYLVYVYLDPHTGRVVASAKVNRFLGNVFPDYEPGAEVTALVTGHNEVGYQVIVDNRHRGMIYDNEAYRPLELENSTTAWVKKVRDDGKIDLTLTRPGTSDRIAEVSEQIMKMLQDGTLALTDRSTPEQIKDVLHCSKKDFKKAVGHLYKLRQIEITDDGLSLAPAKN